MVFTSGKTVVAELMSSLDHGAPHEYEGIGWECFIVPWHE